MNEIIHLCDGFGRKDIENMVYMSDTDSIVVTEKCYEIL